MRKTLLWIIAILITLSTAVFQRITGPTHPVRGKAILDSSEIKYSLARSHKTQKNYEIAIKAQNHNISGYILYKRYKTSDSWTKTLMTRKDDSLVSYIPHQPPAGKLAYKVILVSKGKEVSLSGDPPVIIRFKGHVPETILIPHVLFMVFAMLVSTRAGIEALNPKSNPRKYALWAAGLLFFGGIILGPVVQNFAFGELWTGFPFGIDLTDNKTLIAMIGWIAAVIAGRRGKPARAWVLGASILLLVIFLVPHSLLGSELDYSKVSPPSTLQN